MDIWGSSKRTIQKCAIVGGNFMQTAENVLSSFKMWGGRFWPICATSSSGVAQEK
ncbi:hypothetical protein FH972_019680 [Carpinus fangiana]|uniref:Uncharacterized protein n=1 Tax=Carpinus fangiana TaxID=176857 RepID=A0A5N6RRF8_9ROSI|nr:hypothetical protein FH972_019680 [Carpinus fangiana]